MTKVAATGRNVYRADGKKPPGGHSAVLPKATFIDVFLERRLDG